LRHRETRADEWERRALPLIEGENLLGRGEEVGLRIDVPGVSRCHARIAVQAGRWTLEDLGSKNGTFLRDQRLEAPALLEDGDELRLGRSVLLVFRARPAPGTTNTEA
jgi:pSer/pThr/pTyr-binding forkhead associated (FHA) protein